MDGFLASLGLSDGYTMLVMNPKWSASLPSYSYRVGFSEEEVKVLVEEAATIKALAGHSMVEPPAPPDGKGRLEGITGGRHHKKFQVLWMTVCIHAARIISVLTTCMPGVCFASDRRLGIREHGLGSPGGPLLETAGKLSCKFERGVCMQDEALKVEWTCRFGQADIGHVTCPNRHASSMSASTCLINGWTSVPVLPFSCSPR